jgi:hypothetical protein
MPGALANHHRFSQFIMQKVCTKRKKPKGTFDICGLTSQWRVL